jgi:hypothetical protein
MKTIGKMIRISALSCILAMTASATTAFAEKDWEFQCGLTRKNGKVQLLFKAEAKATSLMQPLKYNLDDDTFEYSDTGIPNDQQPGKLYAINGCAWNPDITLAATKFPPNSPAPLECWERARQLCQTNHTYSKSPGGGRFVTFTETFQATYSQESEAIHTQLSNQCEEKARTAFVNYFEGDTARKVAIDCNNPVTETEITVEGLFGADSGSGTGQEAGHNTQSAISSGSNTIAQMNLWWESQEATYSSEDTSAGTGYDSAAPDPDSIS